MDRARDGYGVVLTASGEVDAVATAARRSAIVAARRRFPVIADERDSNEGRRGRHRVPRLASTRADRLELARSDLWSSWVGTRLRSARG